MVTLGELTPRELANYEQYASDDDIERKAAFVAAATVEAPYAEYEIPPNVEDGPVVDVEATFNSMEENGVRAWFLEWAEDRANELLRSDAAGDNPFWTRYATTKADPETE
jgi:hypothetical protein